MSLTFSFTFVLTINILLHRCLCIVSTMKNLVLSRRYLLISILSTNTFYPNVFVPLQSEVINFESRFFAVC